MSRSIFGWSYPPGCSGPPEPSDGPCEVCGAANFENDCICPECPECGDKGNPCCYESGSKHFHGLLRTKAQLIGMSNMRRAELNDQIQDEALYTEWLMNQPDDYKEQW
jgi:hypothetical protein